MDANRTIEKIQKLAEKKKSAKIIKFLGTSEKEVAVAALEALAKVKDEDRDMIIRMGLKALAGEEPFA